MSNSTLFDSLAEHAPAENSPVSPVSSGVSPKERVHPIPQNSILSDATAFNREVSEAPDSFTVAPLLALVGGLLTPNCYWNFAGRKYCNVFNFVVGPPGIRKSTSFNLAKEVSRRVCNLNQRFEGSASDSAMFSEFEKQAHRIQIEDEANTLLEFFNRQGCGRELASRYLKLYDASSWSQTFKNQEENGEGASKLIECASLSLCIGGTPNTAKFGGLNNASGLRRRFGYYVAFDKARSIPWPEGAKVDYSIKQGFLQLKELSGIFSPDRNAKELFTEIQSWVEQENAKLTGFDQSTEARQAALSESPSRILKLAGIFAASYWAKNNNEGFIDSGKLIVTEERLNEAFEHQKACLEAASEMETMGKRSAIADKAEAILATIQAEKSSETTITFSKSQLTSKFCNNSGRRTGSLSTHELYNEVVPFLESRKECRIQKEQRTSFYHFVGETPDEIGEIGEIGK